MQLLVESGATNTRWMVLEGNQIKVQRNSSGISPYFQTSEQIRETAEGLLLDWKSFITDVSYYGTGVDGKENAKVVQKAFENLLPHLKTIELFSDMMAAARATLQQSKGVVCILGTGSNSCIYDGKKIVKQRRGYGYILGDYGSGSVLGRSLLRDFLHGKMPSNLMNSWSDMGLDSDTGLILEKTYRRQFPNRYLASFTKFASQHDSNAYIQGLLNQHFQDFVNYLIEPLLVGNEKMPINVVGSIGFYFEKSLRQALEINGFVLDKVIKDPSDGLIAYHIQNKS